jgi:hypothetical protein
LPWLSAPISLAEWYQENNVSLMVNKTKELILDFRRQQREHAHIHIDRSSVEKVKSFKFTGVHITDNLKCSIHTDSAALKLLTCLGDWVLLGILDD